jgi:DNA-directed RNA polymerase subunit L
VIMTGTRSRHWRGLNPVMEEVMLEGEFYLDNRTSVLLSLMAAGCIYPFNKVRICHYRQPHTSHAIRRIRIITTVSGIILKP